MKSALICVGTVTTIMGLVCAAVILLDQMCNPAPTPQNDDHAWFFSACGMAAGGVGLVVASAIWL